MKAKHFVGMKLGKLFVESEIDPYLSPSGYRDRRFRCHCDCGKELVVRSSALRRGQQSCGCHRVGNIKHGHAFTGAHSKTYRCWADMIRRCADQSNKDYGGRGITVCERWADFSAFLEDMGEKPTGMTIDRINTDGHYEPGNCRWATNAQQARNKRNNIRLGDAVLTDAAKALGLSHSAISVRLARGWSLQKAMTTPRSHKSLSGHVAKGADHPMARLSQDQVEEIKRRLAAGEKGARLSEEFGMSKSMISRIKLGRAWKIDE